MHEVRPAVPIREGNTLLIKYSLDTRVRYVLYVFNSQKGSIEALNFLYVFTVSNVTTFYHDILVHTAK